MMRGHTDIKTSLIFMKVTVILLVVWYGCGTWSLILKEERRLRIFEKTTERGALLFLLLTEHY